MLGKMTSSLAQGEFETANEFLCLVDPEDPNYGCEFKGWWGGRAGAKSTQLARAAIFRGCLRPLKIVCTREYQNSISDSILALLVDQIRILGLQDCFDVQKNAIYGRNGTKFVFRGLKKNIDSIRSMDGIDLCLVHEAHSISEDSWEVLIPTIRKDGSEIWFEWNPQEDSDPVQQRFIENCPPNSYICNINYDRNPWLTDKSRRNMEYDKKRDYGLYQHIWKGKTRKRTESLVFKHWRVDGDIAPTESDILYYGSDFGFSNDPTTLVRMWIDDDKRELYIDHEAYGIGVEIDDTAELYDMVPGARKWQIVADCARPETISYLKRQGFRIKGAKKGAGSVDEGVKFLQSYNIVVHTRCKHTIAELGAYSWKVDPKTKEILPVLNDADNHIIDPMRYALEARRVRTRIHIG